MITLKTNEIKRFYANASLIKSKGILPILDYILIKNDCVIKTNTEAFIKMDITPVGKTFLIDENTLGRLLKITTSDTITVEVKDKRVYLKDGYNKSFFALPDDASLYPEIPDIYDENEVVISESVLKSIGVASKNISVGNVIPAFNFVHTSNGYVFGSDQYRFYFKKFDNLPTLSFSQLASTILSQFGSASYFQQGNFNVFKIGSLLYGFAKEEVTIPDFQPYLNFISKEEYLEIDVLPVLEFIEYLTGTTSSDTITCDFDKEKLSFYDADLEKGNDVELNVAGEYHLKKSFLPKIIYPFLRSLAKETVRISPMTGGYKGVTIWDKEDTDFIGMIGEATKEN